MDRYYNRHGDVESETTFEVPCKYELPDPPGSWALRGDRVTSLGTNVYDYKNVLNPCIISCHFLHEALPQ